MSSKVTELSTSRDLPVGMIVPYSDAKGYRHVIRGTHHWLDCDGTEIDPKEDPALATVLMIDRPKDEAVKWRQALLHPLKTRSRVQKTEQRQSDWDEGYRYAYGGKVNEYVYTPDLRGRQVVGVPLTPPLSKRWSLRWPFFRRRKTPSYYTGPTNVEDMTTKKYVDGEGR